MTEPCESLCWIEDRGYDAECSLTLDHDGLHVDTFEGWEW